MNYTVKSGDTLSGISTKFDTSVSALAKANNISNPNNIQAGRSLTIPGHSGSSNFQSSSQGGTTYKVKSGDTLSGIAGRFGTTANALAKANNISNPNNIQAGQTLRIPGSAPSKPAPAPSKPSGSTYTVKSGDTLSGIAGRFGTTASALAKANNISNPNQIQVGAKLTIPGGGKPAPTDGVTPTPGPGPTKGGVSLAQLRAIMPNLSAAKAQEYLPHLNAAMAEARIDTPKRQAAFIAQLAHESGEFRWMEEIADGSAYEGRKDLGNTQPGDGRRYKGRGPIQLTGRHNYRVAGAALGLDLEGNPKQVATPQVGFRVAGWYWNSRDLNSYADVGNFDAITLRINGGYNGKADRDRYYARALDVLT